MELLQANRVNAVSWLSRSPELNPMKHIWDVIRREVRRSCPRNVRQLQQFVVEEWTESHSPRLRHVASMRSRCQAVIFKQMAVIPGIDR